VTLLGQVFSQYKKKTMESFLTNSSKRQQRGGSGFGFLMHVDMTRNKGEMLKHLMANNCVSCEVTSICFVTKNVKEQSVV
jgi:hypothetical protein